jgi:hypothetical protein
MFARVCPDFGSELAEIRTARMTLFTCGEPPEVAVSKLVNL